MLADARLVPASGSKGFVTLVGWELVLAVLAPCSSGPLGLMSRRDGHGGASGSCLGG